MEDTGILDLLVPHSSSTKRPFFFFFIFMIPHPLLPSIFSSTLILGWFEPSIRGSRLGGGRGYQGHSQPASRNWTELRPNLHKVQSLRPFLCWRRMIGTVCAPHSSLHVPLSCCFMRKADVEEAMNQAFPFPPPAALTLPRRRGP